MEMELKSTILEMKNITWGLEQRIQNSRRIRELEDRAIEIMTVKHKFKKKKKKPEENEQSSQACRTLSHPRGEEVGEKILQEIIAENSPKKMFCRNG